MSELPPPPPPVRPVADVATAQRLLETVDGLMATTLARASSFAEDERQRRVNDEWSTVESLRHIVLIIDVWLSKSIRGEQDPFHPIALPPTFMPPRLPGSSIDPDARPSYDEACEVVRGRLSTLRDYVASLSEDELVRPIENHAKTVGGGLNVIFEELKAHSHFINRDLDAIEAAR